MKLDKYDEVNIKYLSANTIDGLCDELKRVYSNMKIEGEVRSLSIEANEEYGNPTCTLEVHYTREETDKEKKKREEEKAQQLVWKRKQLEALKKELGE